jgi:hypothetical protein
MMKTAWAKGMFMNEWKDSKEGGGVFIIRFLGGHRLEQVLRLRSGSISASERIKESPFMKLHLKRTSIIEEVSNILVLFRCTREFVDRRIEYIRK